MQAEVNVQPAATAAAAVTAAVHTPAPVVPPRVAPPGVSVVQAVTVEKKKVIEPPRLILKITTKLSIPPRVTTAATVAVVGAPLHAESPVKTVVPTQAEVAQLPKRKLEDEGDGTVGAPEKSARIEE